MRKLPFSSAFKSDRLPGYSRVCASRLNLSFVMRFARYLLCASLADARHFQSLLTNCANCSTSASHFPSFANRFPSSASRCANSPSR